MVKNFAGVLGASLLLAFSNVSTAGNIHINADEYKQVFHGAGGTCDGYVGHWVSMSPENRDLAARMLAQDINLGWIKNYINDRPEVNGKPYDQFVACVNDIRRYNPNIKIHITVNDLPDEFERVDKDGENLKGEVDPTINNVYRKVGNYYFDVLKALHDRGASVDELDILNEPGGGDAIMVKGRLFIDSVNRLRNLIQDTSVNTTGVKMPKIVGPSHWSVDGTKTWLDAWKSSLRQAYDNTDIISTHGYEAGWKAGAYRNIADIIDNKPFYNNEQTAKLQEGDGLYEIWGSDEPDYIGDLSMGLRVIDAIRGGVNAFFVFNLNNPSGNNAALLRTPRNGTPQKSKTYSGFKQVTSLQPKDSHRIGRETSNLNNSRVVALRQSGSNKVYLHIANVNSFSQDVTIDISRRGVKTHDINAVKAWVSDERLDESVVLDQRYQGAQESIQFNMSPYSVNSFEIEISSGSDGGGVVTPTPVSTPVPTLAPTPVPVSTPVPTPRTGEVEYTSPDGQLGVSAIDDSRAIFWAMKQANQTGAYLCSDLCFPADDGGSRWESRFDNLTVGQQYTLKFQPLGAGQEVSWQFTWNGLNGGSGAPTVTPTPLVTPVPTPTVTPAPVVTPVPTTRNPLPEPGNRPATSTPNCVDGAINFNNAVLGPFADQDVRGKQYIVDDGCTLILAGNSWKLANKFTHYMKPGTVLEFEFYSEAEGEIQGILLDTENPVTGNGGRTFQLAGSDQWGIRDYTYVNQGSYQKVSIPVGLYFGGYTMYIGFANDADVNENAITHFRNVRFID